MPGITQVDLTRAGDSFYKYGQSIVAADRDGNELYVPRRAIKTMTYANATGTGAQNDIITLFTVTGEVLVHYIVPFCTTLLTGASATLSLGVTGSTALFIAATTATEIDANEFWIDTTPDANGVAIPAALKEIAITDHIVCEVLTSNITAGVIRYTLLWTPLSSDGYVVAA